MKRLPRAAQAYITAVWLAGAAALVWPTIPFKAGSSAWELALFLVLAALAGQEKFCLVPNRRMESVASCSIGFTITFAAMLHFGPPGCLMVGLMSCLSSCVYPSRQPFFQVAFNLMLTALECRAASGVFLWLNEGSLHVDLVRSFPAVAGASLAYYGINTFGVAVVVALCRRRRPTAVWTESFLWTAPSFFIGGVISTVGTSALGRHIGAALLFGTPIAYLTYRSFAIYSARVEQNSKDLKRLQMSHETLANRYKVATQAAQARKLESIGQLAAGIAHEINTPTQYIGDNTRFLQGAFRDLSELLRRSRELTSGDPALEARISKLNREFDLDYLFAEIPRAIEQNLEGIERVSTIVRAMKEFTHPGSEEKKGVDINQCIESAITVARNEWKYVADVECSLDPDLPSVPCLPGEFSQVILNIIINAAHAIEEQQGAGPAARAAASNRDQLTAGASDRSAPRGLIRVSSRAAGEWVEIRIQDSGGGIPAAIRSRVFDPFFTTKDVGKGTGQGLAIAHSIVVDKHGGRISFETQEGRGTTFLVRLPLQPNARAAA